MRTNYLVPQPTTMHKQLETLLLTYGGSELVCMPEIDWGRLLQGVLMVSKKIVLKRGEPSNCHYNVLRLWLDNPAYYKVASGYALSDDGLWRQHSWLLREDGTIVETTVKRLLYFGYIQEEDEIRESLRELVKTAHNAGIHAQ